MHGWAEAARAEESQCADGSQCAGESQCAGVGAARARGNRSRSRKRGKEKKKRRSILLTPCTTDSRAGLQHGAGGDGWTDRRDIQLRRAAGAPTQRIESQLHAAARVCCRSPSGRPVAVRADALFPSGLRGRMRTARPQLCMHAQCGGDSDSDSESPARAGPPSAHHGFPRCTGGRRRASRCPCSRTDRGTNPAHRDAVSSPRSQARFFPASPPASSAEQRRRGTQRRRQPRPRLGCG